jgi:hypothetical protein
MFPLPILFYVKAGLVVVLLLGAGYTGYSIEAGRFERYKAEQLAQTQKAEQAHQAVADRIRTQKNAQIASINNQLLDAVSQLHSRSNRTQDTANGQDGTGRALSAEDAEFLVREAARADKLRTSLSACYDQYDALSK